MSFKIGINKIYDKYDEFRKCLHLNNSDYSQQLFELYKNDCDHIFSNFLKKEIGAEQADKALCSTDFELIIMAAAMLLDDNRKCGDVTRLGFNDYPGHNNPYDYSWFEEVFEMGGFKYDILGFIQDLYNSNQRFNKMFTDVYDLLEECCDNYHKCIEGITNLCEL